MFGTWGFVVPVWIALSAGVIVFNSKSPDSHVDPPHRAVQRDFAPREADELIEFGRG
jgi:hypothetical protein